MNGDPEIASAVIVWRPLGEEVKVHRTEQAFVASELERNVGRVPGGKHAEGVLVLVIEGHEASCPSIVEGLGGPDACHAGAREAEVCVPAVDRLRTGAIFGREDRDGDYRVREARHKIFHRRRLDAEHVILHSFHLREAGESA